MRTDLAQYYHSTKPSQRLQYMTANDEKVNFEINGTDLMLRDINVFCTTKASHRDMLEKMKQLAVSNNTSGASIYDLGTIMGAESLAELTHVLKQTEAKATAQRQEQMQHEQQMQESENAQKTKEKQMELDADMLENEKNRRRDLLVAEIKASGYGAMQDMNQNQESDFVDQMDTLRKTDEFQQTMGLKQTIQTSKEQTSREKLNIEREKIQAQRDMKETDLTIAKENKNRFDNKKNDKKKK